MTSCKRLNLKDISVKYFMTKGLVAGLAAAGRFSAASYRLPAASLELGTSDEKVPDAVGVWKGYCSGLNGEF